MDVWKIGEKKLIRRIIRKLHSNKNVTVGSGEDDAGCISLYGRNIVMTTDMHFASTHFPNELPPESIGRKVVIASLSDLASMGALPLGILIAFGVPKKFQIETVDKIFYGINKTCEEYNAPLVGGDMKKAKELTICGCGIGVVKKPLLRRNAKPGDTVGITGEVGSAVCGLKGLLKGLRINKKLLNAFAYPHARVKEGMIIAEYAPNSAAIDITDGLLYSANEICVSSGVGIRIDKDKIPISKEALAFAKKNKLSEEELLNTGEDYELLVTIRKNKFEKVKREIEKNGGELIEIGKVIRKRGLFIGGKKITVKGYEAF